MSLPVGGAWTRVTELYCARSVRFLTEDVYSPSWRDLDSNQNRPAYEAGVLPLHHPALTQPPQYQT